MYFFLAETFMPLEINPKRSSVRAFSIMSVLSSDSGLVMPTVYEATWPSATKLWTYTEQRKNSDFANLFLTLLFTNCKTLTHVLEFHQMKIFRWARTWTLTSNRFFRCISTYWDINFVSKCLPACKLVTRFCDIFPLQSIFSSALFHTLFSAMGRRDRI